MNTERIAGPSPKLQQTHTSPLGIIPKPRQPEKWHTITDLSSTQGADVNNAIRAELCSLNYAKVDDVAALVLWV